jgi:hypothetical protein
VNYGSLDFVQAKASVVGSRSSARKLALAARSFAGTQRDGSRHRRQTGSKVNDL